METRWTPERIESLQKACKKHIAEKNYAKLIAEQIDSLKTLYQQIREAYDKDYSYEQLEIMWKMQDRMERSIQMKIKHFFVIVYGKDNAFNNNLKGKDYVEHYFTFKDFVNGGVYGMKIS